MGRWKVAPLCITARHGKASMTNSEKIQRSQRPVPRANQQLRNLALSIEKMEGDEPYNMTTEDVKA